MTLCLRLSPVRLLEARERAHLSQSKAARAAGISRATLQNVEGGRHQPTVSTLAALATLYGCSIDWLFVPVPVDDEVVEAAPAAETAA